MNKIQFKTRKEVSAFLKERNIDTTNWTEDKWQSINKSQAEIHIQKIAEMMWNCYNESKPKTLQAGEWHIPYGDNLDPASLPYWEEFVPNANNIDLSLIKIATARAARISYTTLGDNPKIDYEADIKLHDRLLESKHLSCFEHCARAMTDKEYQTSVKGEIRKTFNGGPEGEVYQIPSYTQGWCNNYRGFIQYRYLIENQ